MVADPVPILDDLHIFLRELVYIVAYHEECGFYAVTSELLNDPWGHHRYRSVIKGQVNSLLIGVHAPQSLRVEVADELGYLFYEHTISSLLLMHVHELHQ